MFADILKVFKRKKEFRSYEFENVEFNLPVDGIVRYARWLHPGEHTAVTQEHVNFYRRYVRKGDFVIDIGANEGNRSVPMALAAGKEGLTLALEPNPHVYKVLVENASLNKDKTTIKPLNFAATAYDGEFTFGSGDPTYGNGGIVGFTHNKARNTRFTFKVTGKNLEKYLIQNYPNHLSRLSFIKIDTEGYDKEILKTMPEIINQCKPVLVTECFGPSTKEEKKELYTILSDQHYTLYRLANFFDSSPQEKITLGDMSRKKTFDILALPGKI